MQSFPLQCQVAFTNELQYWCAINVWMTTMQCAITHSITYKSVLCPVRVRWFSKVSTNLRRLHFFSYSFREAITYHIALLVHGGFGWLLGWKLHIPYSFSYEKVTLQSSDLGSLNSDHDAFPQTTREINKWLKSSAVKGKNGKEG